jgi:hypothetical protein
VLAEDEDQALVPDVLERLAPAAISSPRESVRRTASLLLRRKPQ